MLTKVTAYSQWANVDPLVLNIVDRPETDLFEVRNIDGLGAVKADVNTADRGQIKGRGFIGTNVGERNLVFTVGLTPDWENYTISKLRRLLDKYFIPEQKIRFEFESDEFSPVEISGYIESNEPSIFSRDSEHQISVICPEPDFVAVAPVIMTGLKSDGVIPVPYEGTVETGLFVRLENESSLNPSYVSFQVREMIDGVLVENDIIVSEDPWGNPFEVYDNIRISTLPGNKYVQGFEHATPEEGPGVNILARTTVDKWLVISPNIAGVQAQSDMGEISWRLEYHNRFGSL